MSDSIASNADAIDTDVWRPFMASYPALDADLSCSVYSESLIHASGVAGNVQGYEEYLGELRGFFDFARERGDAFAIEFRFTERLAGDGVASERGVFRIDTRLASGEERISFGRFHVFLRLEQGRWRIVTDFDEGGAVEGDFEAAIPIT